MQARAKIVIILVVALIVSLVLVGRGGGTSGSTWFNLPSVKVTVQPDGTAKVYGFNIGMVLQPALIQQLQAANIQKLEARIGYNGIHVYVNGEDMPYIEWDQEKTETLQQVIRSMPGVPNGNLIANLLPWARKIGLGAALHLPIADGTAKLDIPRWKGETAVSRETSAETTIGPITIGSLVFDENGQAIIEGIPASTLEQLTGGPVLPTLDANTLGILNSLGVDAVRIATHPNGINLSLNDDPLPGIAYDSASLGRLQAQMGAFISDPAMLEMVNQIVPLLPGADISAAISFTGEPAAETQLSAITVAVGADGTVESVAGVPLPAGIALPADVVQKLGAANVDSLSVQVAPEGLSITAGERALPAITWNEESMQTVAELVGPLAGLSPELVDTLMGTALNLGIDVSVQLPEAAGEAAPAEAAQPVDLSGMTVPFIKLEAAYGDQGFTQVGGLSADTLAQLGVSLPALPPEVMGVLKAQGVSQLQIKSGESQLEILLDGEKALGIDYDGESLATALDLAMPFLGDSPVLQDPTMMKFIREQILPLAPLAQIDVTLNLE